MNFISTLCLFPIISLNFFYQTAYTMPPFTCNAIASPTSTITRSQKIHSFAEVTKNKIETIPHQRLYKNNKKNQQQTSKVQMQTKIISQLQWRTPATLVIALFKFAFHQFLFRPSKPHNRNGSQ